jgi:ankyrin
VVIVNIVWGIIGDMYANLLNIMSKHRLYTILWWFFVLGRGIPLALLMPAFSILFLLPIGLTKAFLFDKPIYKAIRDKDLTAIENYAAAGNNLDIHGTQKETPLELAIRSQNEAIVELLLRLGANPNFKSSSGDSPLWLATEKKWTAIADHLISYGATVDPVIAIFQRDFDQVDRLLSEGLDPNYAIKPANTTLIQAAARVNALELVEILLSRGADVHQIDREGRTALHYAAASPEVTARLLQAGANPRSTKQTSSPLHQAVKEANLSVIELLLANNADANGIGNPTPLQDAVEAGHTEVVALLIQYGADVNCRPSLRRFNDMPLHCAAEEGRLEIAHLLLDAGADVNAESGMGCSTPLHRAIGKKHLEVAKLLLDRGAQPSAKNLIGITPLQLAGQSSEARELLRSYGATSKTNITESITVGDLTLVQQYLDQLGDPNKTESKGSNTLLHLATQYGHAEVAQLLIEQGAVIDAKNRDGATPLYYAAYGNSEGHGAIADLLISKGALIDLEIAALRGDIAAIADYLNQGGNANVKFSDRPTLLGIAAFKQNFELLELLLAQGADVDVASPLTPLQVAVGTGNVELVERLVLAGADINRKVPRVGFTPLLQVAMTNQLEMAECLLRNGADPSIGSNFPARFTPMMVAREPEMQELLKRYAQ